MKRPAIVVGSGFGGIAAALRLRALGYEVLVLEARDQPGGRAAVFRRDGYTFDAGPTVITAPHLFDELFELHGRKREDYVELLPVDPFYRIAFADGSSFDYVQDGERLLEEIRRFHPPDVAGYERMVEQSKQIFEVGYEQLADVPFESITDMLKILPQMLRLGSFRSVYAMVSKYLEDERLRQVFSFQPLLVGGHPFRVTSIYALIHWLERKWGVYFAKGGTGALVAALVRLLEEVGVTIRYSAPINRIDVDDGGRARSVVLESGERIDGEIVVCNADPSVVYAHMIDPRFRKKHTDRRIKRLDQSMGLFVGYFGTDRTYPELAHHTIVLGPRYRGLLDDIFQSKVLAEDFSLYLHAPTRTDPSMAPEGHEAFYVLSPVPNNVSGIDWRQEGERYFERILAELERRVLPELSKHLTTRFFVTPNYFATELRSMNGAAFGIEPTLRQSAYFRYHNRSEDVDGLFFVGAGTHPGAGLPGVLNSARVLERCVRRAEA
ncbi:MAG: phytoene desaturase [Deltaproteobacteria bacterium]